MDNELTRTLTCDSVNKTPKTDDDDGRMIMMRNVFAEWWTSERRLALFPAQTTVRDSPHHESPTCHEQDLRLLRN